jgi:hypothetical protein
MPRRTALIAAIPAAAGYYSPGNGVPAHVTVLFPFLPPEEIDEASLEALFARFRAFDVTFDRLERFEDGTPWLHPSPSAPFVDLTSAVWQRWPGHPPYEGAHDEPIPHLTVTTTEVALPFSARVDEVTLIEEREEDGAWVTRRAFALAQGVA